MDQLRPLSPRPELVVGSPDAARIEDPVPDFSQVGVETTPVIGARVLTALPFNKIGPVQLERASALHANTLLVDPTGNVIGSSGPVWVHRMLYAAPNEGTRRLAV